jgi:putative ABC transport system permease protein
MSSLLARVRRVGHSLLRAPLFTTIAVITLAVGIGANTAIFSVVYAVLLKPLPFDEPERLVGVWHTAPGLNIPLLNQGPATYLTYREENHVFEQIGLWDGGAVSVTGRGEPEKVDVLMVSDSTLPALRVQPLLGRRFTPDDDSPRTPERVMLTYGYWQKKFGGSRDVVGQTLTVEGKPNEIIGVLPADFRFLNQKPALLLPFRFNRAELFVGNFSYQAVARLRRGVTIAQANADIARMLPMTMDRFPLPPGFTRKMFEETRMGPLVRPFADDLVGDVRPMLWVLVGTVGMVLLIACANVANLFLVRAEGRQQELAIRSALGASWGRLASELLSESVVLGALGGLVGLGLAAAGIRLLAAIGPKDLPRLDEIGIDPVVLAFTLGISLLAGILFALIPVLRFARPRLAAALKEGGRGASDGRERHRARSALVIAEVALAVVLLVGSGLMIRTFQAMRRVQPGFTKPEEVLTLRVTIPEALVKEDDASARMHQQIAQRLEQLPGVASVGLSSAITMDGHDSNDPIFVEERPGPPGRIPPIRRFKFVGARYTETMGNRLLAGRTITWADSFNLAKVAVVSENFAREYFTTPGAALGRRIRQGPDSPWREIVGVVADERDDGIGRPAPTVIYWPLLMQDFWQKGLTTRRTMAYAVRGSRMGSPTLLKEIQQAVWSVNPGLPLAEVRSLEELREESMAQTSFTLVMLAIAAGGALLLGIVGIYGVIAYIAAQRTREIGIRVALGAQVSDVSRLFVRHGLVLTAAGLVLGLAGAAGLTRLMSTLLFGVGALDPLTFATAAIVLGAVALLASYLPARRAARVDPVIALRGEHS